MLAARAIADSGSKLELKTLPGRGRALCATRACTAGEVLLTEPPVAHVQLPGSAEVCQVCANCMRRLGSLSDLLNAIGVQSRAPALPAAPTEKPQLGPGPKPFTCRHCDVMYCSVQCRDAHWAHAHRAVCGANPAHRSAWAAFVKFASESCQTQLLAAELVVASVLQGEHERPAAPAGKAGSGPTWEEEYVCAPWPSLVVLPEGCTAKEEAEARAACVASCARGRRLLLQALRLGGLGNRKLELWLTPGRWERLVGLVTQNAAAIAHASPLKAHVEALLRRVTEAARRGGVGGRAAALSRFTTELSDAAARVAEEAGQGGEEADDEGEGEGDGESEGDDAGESGGEGESEGDDAGESEGEGESEGDDAGGEGESDGQGDEDDAEWQLPKDSPLEGDARRLASAFNRLPDAEGSGLYPALALINHSCAANVAIEFLGDGGAASIVALRPIGRGEEVCHCYVPLGDFPDMGERRRHLRGQHGFMCDCETCAAESAREGEAEALGLFFEAQAHESEGDCEAAAAKYEAVVARHAAGGGTGAPYTEAAAMGARAPPSALAASTALNSLGGYALDAGALSAARAAFLRALELWPANGMALINLGDLEREHGSLPAAIGHYERAAALPSVPYVGGWHDQWVGEPTAKCRALASYMVALLLHQCGAYARALPYLQRFGGVRYRMAPAVWDLVSSRPSDRPADVALSRGAAADARVVRRWDGAVPPVLLASLQAAFAVDSPFWRETGYADRGYFSFWYDAREPPANAVEALARHLLPFTGCGDRVVGCEWWVHTRSEGRSMGHQMHFDTEEATLAGGRLCHPAVSSVTYLSGAGGGDPTVVFDQRPDDDAAASAAVSHPVAGSVLLFPGDRLHCVCPAAPAGHRKRPRAAAGAGPLRTAAEQPQRLTLMIGFWVDDVVHACRRQPLGACGPVPRASRACTWPRALVIPPDYTVAPSCSGPAAREASGQTGGPAQGLVPTCRAVPSVPDPWERVAPPERGPRRDGPVGSARGPGGGDGGGWVGRFKVPEDRNHLLFVAGLDAFRAQLVRDGYRPGPPRKRGKAGGTA